LTSIIKIEKDFLLIAVIDLMEKVLISCD